MKRLSLPAAALLLVACGADHTEFQIEDVRDVAEAMKLGAPDSVRLSLPEEKQEKPVAPPPTARKQFAFELPEGWQDLGSGFMRDLNFQAPGEVECWVTVLAGDGGGQVANLTRWRGEVGLGAADAGMMAALPRTTMLGQNAYRVDLIDAEKTRRQVGVMLFEGQRAVFLKMRGAPAAVEAQIANFDALCQSLREEEPSSGLKFAAPEGWSELAGDQMRKLFFDTGDGVRAWVSSFPGDGGGLGGNVARWYRQAGVDAPDASVLDTLPKVPVLGGEGVLVDLSGEGVETGLLAVAHFTATDSWFIKMQGPPAAVAARREAFLAFCASLEVDE